MFFRRLPLFLLLLALSVLPGMAQSHRDIFSIGGTIRDNIDQHAMENVQLTLKQLTGPTVGTAYTRGDGDCQCDALPNGDYIVEIIVRDYEPVRETLTISGSSHLGLSIFLSRSPGKAANPV